jgi:thiamine-monophosphate kinase
MTRSGSPVSWGAPPPAAARLFRRPTPRIREARWLVEHAALHALIDLSDGLAGDAGHLAAASGVGITLAAADVPVHPDAAGVGPIDRALQLALGGGEDYELCLAVAPGTVEGVREAFTARFGLGLTRVGSARPGDGVTILDAQGRRLDMHAFRHFEDAGGMD